MYFVGFIHGEGLVGRNATHSKVQLSSLKEGWGTLGSRRSAFSIVRVQAGYYFVD